MKKNIKRVLSFVLAVLIVLNITGCKKKDSNELIVGATSVPHAELLNLVKSDFEASGYKLTIKEFSDYTLLNPALKDGSLDVNFFQHKPYLDQYNEQNSSKNKLASVAEIHIEPIGIYSGKKTDLANITGSSITIPNDPTNGGRALLFLQSLGYITLKDNCGITPTIVDIKTNNSNLTFKELDAASIPTNRNESDFAIINTNYALEHKIDPKTALSKETNSPYANILAVKEKDVNDAKVLKLVEVLKTQKVIDYINTTYSGAVVPAFTK